MVFEVISLNNYKYLSKETEERIKSDRENHTLPSVAFDESKVLRRNSSRDVATVLRTAFIRDIDKIIHCPYYNRYTDKTQVFSFYKNDDITRRALHVQLVSRIARTIGKALSLNIDLIEAIALGHDIGHTPFGHAGERFLDELFYEHAGRHFSHNIHSVRVLDGIYSYNISLQTLNGIASHDGEMELSHYAPKEMNSFDEFDRCIEECYFDKSNVRKLIPSTLEGCVVRIADIIAYLGKDRQDAERANIRDSEKYIGGAIGTNNSEIIRNLTVNIVENSYGKPFIMMDEEHFEALKKAKADNYALIYKNKKVALEFDNTIRPMMRNIYEKLLDDLITGRKESPIFSHHIDFVNSSHYTRKTPYEQTEPNQIVVDFIASMTDDYFIDLHSYLFPKNSLKIVYKGYFD